MSEVDTNRQKGPEDDTRSDPIEKGDITLAFENAAPGVSFDPSIPPFKGKVNVDVRALIGSSGMSRPLRDDEPLGLGGEEMSPFAIPAKRGPDIALIGDETIAVGRSQTDVPKNGDETVPVGRGIFPVDPDLGEITMQSNFLPATPPSPLRAELRQPEGATPVDPLELIVAGFREALEAEETQKRAARLHPGDRTIAVDTASNPLRNMAFRFQLLSRVNSNLGTFKIKRGEETWTFEAQINEKLAEENGSGGRKAIFVLCLTKTIHRIVKSADLENVKAKYLSMLPKPKIEQKLVTGSGEFYELKIGFPLEEHLFPEATILRHNLEGSERNIMAFIRALVGAK